VTASANVVEPEEGWSDMKMKGLGKLIGAPVGAVGKVLGIKELGGGKTGSVGPLKMASLVKDLEGKTALEEGKARIAAGPQVTQMKKGGMVKKGYHKMPDGKMMKDSAHKKMTKKSTASKRADGICMKGKTKGRMC